MSTNSIPCISTTDTPSRYVPLWIRALTVISPLWIPIAFVVYSLKTFHQRPNVPLVIDSLAFLFAAATLFAVTASIRSKAWRHVLIGGLTMILIVIFVGNRAYVRFFGEWVHWEILREWKLGPSVFWDTLRHLDGWDWIAGIGVPVGLWLLLSYKPYWARPHIWLLAGPIFLVVCWPLHALSRDQIFDPQEHNVAMMLLRGWWYNWQGLYAREEGQLDPFFLGVAWGYRPAGIPTMPLIREPDPEQAFSPALPLAPDKPRPNIVLVLMESVRAFEMGAYGRNPSFTPNLDRLASQGLLFKNFYAVGNQTVRGEFALLASLHDTYNGSPVYIRHPQIRIQTLPQILKAHGYSTAWISSFRRSYHNKDRFLLTHGIDRMYDQEGMPRNLPRINWGPPDEELFRYALDILDQQPQPFFVEIMTLTNHYPFEGPYPTRHQAPPVNDPNPIYKNFCHGTFYTDYAIGRFMEAVRSKPYFDNTIFIFTADHGIWLFPTLLNLSTVRKQEIFTRIPLIFYAPRLIQPRVSEVPGSQIDLAPTVLHMLGIRHRNAFTGRSLLEPCPPEQRLVLSPHSYGWNLRIGNLRLYNVGQAFEEFTDVHHPAHMRKSLARHYQGLVSEVDLLWESPAPETSVTDVQAIDRLVHRVEQHLRALNELKRRDHVFDGP